jgi:hypothetical protein
MHQIRDKSGAEAAITANERGETSRRSPARPGSAIDRQKRLWHKPLHGLSIFASP